MNAVATCMHGTWKEFDLVALHGVDGLVGKVEQVLPTSLDKVQHRDLPHFVVKVRWRRAATRDEYGLERFEVPPDRPADRDGVSYEVCQDLRRFGWD